MIDPNSFYSKESTPAENVKRNMWTSISQSLFHPRSTVSFDRKSFFYGIAASFVLMFTFIGIYTTVKQVIDVAQPQEIRTDRAYQSAIHEFENVLFSNENGSSSLQKNNHNVLRKKQLQFLDDAINELRHETNSHDLSPLKRQRLHELYTMKLSLLQEMVQQGEIEL